MPTYDYECTSCKKVIEIFQQMSEEPLKKCPECGGKIKRLVGGGLGIIFKGNGFYVTDSKNKSSASSLKSDKKAAESSSASSEGKSSSESASCTSCQDSACQPSVKNK